MNIKIKPPYLIGFLSLVFLMHELHEIVHTSIGRAICGCWGQRDFNVWGLCDGCEKEHPIALLATFAGPIFTFFMIWWGASLLKSTNTDEQKSLGFSLVFANIPFARIFTACLGGGDEAFGLNKMLHNHRLSSIIALVFSLLMTVYPLMLAYKAIGNRHRFWLFVLFFLAPMFVDLLVVLGLMNNLLSGGVLSNYWILGSPVLVTVWTAAVVTTFLLTKRYLYCIQGDTGLATGKRHATRQTESILP
jgi:hypothetical protein